MTKDILVFKKDNTALTSNSNIRLDYRLEVWRPGVFTFVPPNKGIKYFFYWIFYMFGIFKNSNYASYLLYDNGILVSSCLVVPSYYKWPFMGNNDIQFTYVVTNENYRGQGLAGKLIEKAMADFSHQSDAFWYITDTQNPASIRVAEKLGFRCQGKAERSFLKILRYSASNG